MTVTALHKKLIYYRHCLHIFSLDILETYLEKLTTLVLVVL